MLTCDRRDAVVTVGDGSEPADAAPTAVTPADRTRATRVRMPEWVNRARLVLVCMCRVHTHAIATQYVHLVCANELV